MIKTYRPCKTPEDVRKSTFLQETETGKWVKTSKVISKKELEECVIVSKVS